MSERLDAVVALSGEFSADLNDIGPGTRERMDAAISIVHDTDVPLVVSGNYPFRWRTAPPRPLAQFMEQYAIDQGVPKSMIIVQDESRDTIGDAVLTKVQVTEPRQWRRLVIVTSDTHVPRSQHIFEHVMGPEYTIIGKGAGAAEEVKFQRLQELVGNLLVRAVLAPTQPGDTEAIQARLFRIIPGYAEVPAFNRALGFAGGLLAK